MENKGFTLNRPGNRYGEPVRLYYTTDSQNVVRRGNIDPLKMNYKVKVLGDNRVNSTDSRIIGAVSIKDIRVLQN